MKTDVPRIAFDLDGCIADTLPVILNTIYDKFKVVIKQTELKRFEIESISDLTPSQVHVCVTDAIGKVNQIKPIPGAIEFIKKYHAASKRIIQIITARGAHDGEATIEWLNKHFDGVPYSFVGTKQKAEACVDLGIEYFVEDRAKYARQVSSVGTTVFLLDYLWNKHLPESDRVIRMKDWKSIDAYFSF